ncbi:MAG: EipA family protein [Pseudomonadota bacterium]
MTDAAVNASFANKADAYAAAPDAAPRWRVAGLAVLAGVAALFSLWASPLAAQDLETFDPDEAFAQAPADNGPDTAETSGAIDADLAPPPSSDAGPTPTTQPLPVAKPLPSEQAQEPADTVDDQFRVYADPPAGEAAQPAAEVADALPAEGTVATASSNTFAQDDLIGAAEGVFGKGAEGLARIIADLLKKEGQPNGYIVGREAGGAFVVGARYGSGTLHHKVEGERKVYWTGPSVGFDAGANAANTFVLVYNLWDSEDLFKRFPAGEGQAYFIGGLHASYVRRGDVVLIPIRMGAGVRLGVNAGYMRFSKKQRWLPF